MDERKQNYTEFSNGIFNLGMPENLYSINRAEQRLRMCVTGRGLGSRMVSNFKGFVGNRLGM